MESYSVQTKTRLLSFAKKNLPFSTKDLSWTIEHGRCFVNGYVDRFLSTQLKEGDNIQIEPIIRPTFIREDDRVLYEDDFMLIYNKPAYISSPDLAELLKLTLVHRLDRDTTGVILFAKKDEKKFTDLFKKRKIDKRYYALVKGSLKKDGMFEAHVAPIKRREGAVVWGPNPDGLFSQTKFKSEKKTAFCSKICCNPITGRTHQIRLHLKLLGCPVIGDFEYGSRLGTPGLFRPMLHASSIRIGNIAVQAPLPEDFVEWERKIFENGEKIC